MSLLYTTISPAINPAVSVADCKDDLRIEQSFIMDDDLILSYINAASKYASEVVGRKLISETIKYSIPNFCNTLVLPFTPVSEITEIQYFDVDDVTQVLDVADFYLYNFDNKTELVAKAGVVLPSVFNRRDSVNISFITGFGIDSSDITETITRAIRLLVAHWYENRSSTIVGFAVNEVPMGVESMLGSERIGWVA